MVRTPQLVPKILRQYGDITRIALKQYLPAGHPSRYFYDPLSDYPLRGGKMMRSSICIANARVFGAGLNDALCSAVAIELLHNALLIHDDIQDGSEIRRGRPALHVLHGIPLAINAGDGLFLLSLRPLLDNVNNIGPELAVEILRETERMAWQSAEGQAMELGWRRENKIFLNDSDYLTMVLKKTCWLAVIYPSRIGALIGTHKPAQLDRFVRFGFFLGATFQIQDDLLNLIADSRYGKELNGDIFEGKRTLMLIHASRQCTKRERARLSELLKLPREERGVSDVEWIRNLMEKYGSVEYARSVAHGLAGAALHEYSCIYDDLPHSIDKEFIRGLVTWVFERT